MTSVNLAAIQFYDKGNDRAIKSYNFDIRVAVLFSSPEPKVHW